MVSCFRVVQNHKYFNEAQKRLTVMFLIFKFLRIQVFSLQ